MWIIITIFDILLFAIVVPTVVYLLFFSFIATRYERIETGMTRKKGRFFIITTVTMQDKDIEDCIKSVVRQDYDAKDYDHIVVGIGLTPLQAMKLAQFPITLLNLKDANLTKSEAQKYAMQNHHSMKIYDLIIFLDPNETVQEDFFTEVNKVLQAGIRFFQLHRRPLHTKTHAAILSCTMDEINNSIFRKGHVACGMPSALSSSATALDYEWYKNNVDKISESDGEKSTEALLLKQHIFVDYIDDVCVYNRSASSHAEIAQQRRTWMKSRLSTLLVNLKQLLPALLHWNLNMSDKIFQWIMVPRLLLMAIIVFMSITLPFIYFTMVIKWWLIFLVVTFTFAVATPDYIVDKEWTRSMLHLPILLAGSIINAILSFTSIKKIIKK